MNRKATARMKEIFNQEFANSWQADPSLDSILIPGSLPTAAACYLQSARLLSQQNIATDEAPPNWPFANRLWKFSHNVINLYTYAACYYFAELIRTKRTGEDYQFTEDALRCHAELEALLTRPDPFAAPGTEAQEESPEDLVNHPKHYNSHPSGIEVIEITRHMGFNLGNVIKYVLRADHKGATIQDLEKAAWYLNDEINKRKGEI